MTGSPFLLIRKLWSGLFDPKSRPISRKWAAILSPGPKYVTENYRFLVVNFEPRSLAYVTNIVQIIVITEISELLLTDCFSMKLF